VTPNLPMLLVAALVLDAVFGEPEPIWRRVPHPAVLKGRLIGWLERHLNRGAYRRAKGCLAVLVLIAIGGAMGWALSRLGPVADCTVAAILLAHRSLVQHVSAVAADLRTSLNDGRRTVTMIVSRDTADMDTSHVARSAIESAAENLSDGVVAPAFWFLIGGLPGILIYKFVNTADSMIGYRNARFEEFGWVAARLDDVMNLLPARLTGALIALGQRQLRAWPEIVADARRHRSPNAGWPEAAMARGLGIALAGPRSYDGTLRDLAWVNAAGRRTIGAAEIDAAVRVLWQVWRSVLLILALSALALVLLPGPGTVPGY